MMTGVAGVWLGATVLVTLTAHGESPRQQPRGWWQVGRTPGVTARAQAAQTPAVITRSQPGQLSSQPFRDFLEGQRLFDRERILRRRWTAGIPTDDRDAARGGARIEIAVVAVAGESGLHRR